MNRVVGIIPARGGSKGIPRKNIKLILGKPLIQHTIEAALASKRIDEVYVSTDDSEIASISESLGALIIDRPVELAGDRVSTFDVMKHAEETLNSPDVLVVLQPTSPLRNAQEIDKAIALLEPDVDTVVGVCELKKYQWNINGNYAQPAFVERLPRQLMEKKYGENGSIYVTRSKTYKDSDSQLGMGILSRGKTKLFEMEEKHSYEIDCDFDWYIIELLLKLELENKE